MINEPYYLIRAKSARGHLTRLIKLLEQSESEHDKEKIALDYDMTLHALINSLTSYVGQK